MIIWLPIILLLNGCNLVNLLPQREPVTSQTAAEALTYARSQIGAPYEWGGNGPDAFDCSGLVVYVYQQAYGATDIFTDGKKVFNDVTADTLFRSNTKTVEPPQQVIPGDLIFISSEKDRITHVGLVVKVLENEVKIIHSSYYEGKVLEEYWPLNQEVRGQDIAGFGRLLLPVTQSVPHPLHMHSQESACMFCCCSSSAVFSRE